MLVRELVLKNPRSIPVLRHYGIDYCCGGDIDFDEACAIQEVDPKRVLADIVAAPPAPEHDWAHQPLDKLIDHIQARYHDPLYGDLEEIIALGQKVARAHADDHGEQLEAIVASLQALQKDLLPHLKKEEDIFHSQKVADAAKGRGGTDNGTRAAAGMAVEPAAAAPVMAARISSVMAGEGDSAMIFCLRRWTEQSRSNRCTRLPCLSPRI